MLDLPKKWYRECIEHHLLCAAPDPAFRPTRLIEILDQSSVRLIISKSEGVKDTYVAFSHCWGKAKTLKLLESNLSELQSGISDSELPTSYKEALVVCRSMGFRYIWIDSLCIIQDSSEDWQQEALTMKDVYQNSTLNLCASAAAENSQASFASRDLSLICPLKVTPSWIDAKERSESWYISLFDMYAEEVENSPLISRAWVVQEHYLSHRSLHMTKSQLWWGCRQHLACESFPGGFPKASLRPLTSEAMADAKEQETTNKEDQRQTDARWYKLVEDYARCGLTVSTDKLIAFAGIAQTFTRVFREDQYVAGMWRSQLPLALCWYPDDYTQTYRPRTYIAPSWSWASVKGEINFPLIHNQVCYDGDIEEMKTPIEIHCEVSDVRINLKDARYTTGQVTSGQLDLQAHIIGPVTWSRDEEGSVIITIKPNWSLVLSLEHGGEVNFDETSRDGTSRMAWLDGSTTDEHPENESKTTGPEPASFLVPIASFDANICDPQHSPATYGIVICRVEGSSGVRHYRVGSFGHLVLPPGMLDAFPHQNITIV